MHICAADDSVDQARSEQAKSVKDFEAQSYNHFSGIIQTHSQHMTSPTTRSTFPILYIKICF